MAQHGTQARPRRRPVRAGIAAATVAVCLVVGACGGTAEPDPDAATDEDLAEVLDRLEALEDQVDGLADDVAGLATPTPTSPTSADDGAADDDLLAQVRDSVGEQVTVEATVAEVVETTTLGSAFRVAGPSGSRVPVVSATPVPGLAADDVVRVTGVVARVAEESFEEDFGIAAEQLLEDPEAFFAVSGGRPAVSATEVDVVGGDGG